MSQYKGEMAILHTHIFENTSFALFEISCMQQYRYVKPTGKLKSIMQ